MPQCEKTTRAGPALFMQTQTNSILNYYSIRLQETQPDIDTGHCLVNSALGSYSTSGPVPVVLAYTDCVWMLMNESRPFIQHNMTVLSVQASLISFHRYLYLKCTHILIYCFVSRVCFYKGYYAYWIFLKSQIKSVYQLC